MRRILITPMATPSRSNGVQETSECPTLMTILLSGNSASTPQQDHECELFVGQEWLGLTGVPRLMWFRTPALADVPIATATSR